MVRSIARKLTGAAMHQAQTAESRLMGAMQAAQKSSTQNGAASYSLKETADGERITVVDTRQNVFDNQPRANYGRIARKEILAYFKGQTLPLGSNDLARITNRTASEYAYPSRRADENLYDAKMKAAPELDNLLSTAEYLSSDEDTKNHREATLGFDYYLAKFIMDGHLFEGVLNIANSESGRILYDFTNIKEVPDRGKYATLMAQSTSSSRGDFKSLSPLSHASHEMSPETDNARNAGSTAFRNSIPNSSENSNTQSGEKSGRQYSLKQPQSENEKLLRRQEREIEQLKARLADARRETRRTTEKEMSPAQLRPYKSREVLRLLETYCPAFSPSTQAVLPFDAYLFPIPPIF